ncbi:MAG: enoyl-CoA hydratase/isomerase family protein, partial [Actinobacteria bacterium]|nr:enoyl-CoA hydratase/isomerase family protein [Actinomycetota bacterium]
MSDELVRERRGHVLVVRLNRPEARNALNAAVLTGLGQAVQEAEADPEIRALVLTGTGDRAFSAGMDLRSFASGEAASVDRDAMDAFYRLIQGKVTVPVVGAANATALAGG